MAKKKSSAEEILAQMYPDLKTSDDYADPAAKQAAAAAPNAEVAALQAKLAALEGQIAVSQRTAAALTSQQTRDMPPQAPVIDYSKAPDPVEDLAGYTKFMLDAQEARINYEKQAIGYNQRQQQAVATKTATLWDTFKATHGDYTKDEKRIEIATTQVINRAKAMGLDTERYMYGNSDQFMKDVVAEFDGLFGKPGGGGGQSVTTDDEDDDADDRATVLGGGVATQQGQTAGKQPPPRYGNLSQEVMTWQEKTGFRA